MALPDYVTGKDSIFTFKREEVIRKDGSRAVLLIPVRKHPVKVKKEKAKKEPEFFIKI